MIGGMGVVGVFSLMPKVPVKLGKKVLEEALRVQKNPSVPMGVRLSKEPTKKGLAKIALQQPDFSEEEVEDKGVVEALTEAGEFGESGLSTVAFGSGLASLLRMKGAAGLATKAGRGAGLATVALQGVDLARTLTDDDYREEVKASLEGMDGVDAFQQGVTRLPSMLNALQEVNLETAEQFQDVEDQELNTDRKFQELKMKRKARQEETNRINEDQRRALEAPSAEEKIRMAKLEDEMEKQNARNMVRSYLEGQGLV